MFNLRQPSAGWSALQVGIRGRNDMEKFLREVDNNARTVKGRGENNCERKSV